MICFIIQLTKFELILKFHVSYFSHTSLVLICIFLSKACTHPFDSENKSYFEFLFFYSMKSVFCRGFESKSEKLEYKE